jgi:hypothetical protein
VFLSAAAHTDEPNSHPLIRTRSRCRAAWQCRENGTGSRRCKE